MTRLQPLMVYQLKYKCGSQKLVIRLFDFLTCVWEQSSVPWQFMDTSAKHLYKHKASHHVFVIIIEEPPCLNVDSDPEEALLTWCLQKTVSTENNVL